MTEIILVMITLTTTAGKSFFKHDTGEESETMENDDLKEKNIMQECLSQLDYTLETSEERIELVNNLLCDEYGKLKQFFELLYDEDEYKKNIKGHKENNQKYIDVVLNKQHRLSSDIYECVGLEKMADYILLAPDQPRLDEQEEYTFYTDRKEFEQALERELLYEGVVAKMRQRERESGDGDENFVDIDQCIHTIGNLNYDTQKRNFSKIRIERAKYIDSDEKMAFFKRVDNYKFDGKVVITQSDLKDPEMLYLQELEDEIQYLRTWKKNNPFSSSMHIVNGMIGSLQQAQIDYKIYKKKIFGFKNPLRDNGRVDYGEFDFFDKEHVLALMNMPKRQICDEDLPLLIYDLEILLNEIKIRDEDREVVELYRKGVSQQEIADTLEVTRQNVNQVLSKLADDITQQYEKIYEDWYYLNKVKGKYKKCSRCGEVELMNRFKKDATKIDGRRYNCKKCDKSA